MRDVSFGQYYPAQSFIHRMDARIKFLLMIAYITFIFFIKSYAGFALAAVILIIIVIASRVPPKLVLRSLRMIIFLIIFTGILNIFFYGGAGGEVPLWSWKFIKIRESSLHYAAKMALRLMLLVLGPSVLTLTTTPVQMTNAIESLLWPLKLIRFPVHELAMIMSLALSIVPTLMDETDKIIKAQKARGADFESGNLFKRAKALIPILIPLFVSSFRRADDLALAMDSRCYKGGKGRTKLRIPHMTWRDAVAVIFMLVFGAAILFLRYNWLGWQFIIDLNTLWGSVV